MRSAVAGRCVARRRARRWVWRRARRRRATPPPPAPRRRREARRRRPPRPRSIPAGVACAAADLVTPAWRGPRARRAPSSSPSRCTTPRRAPCPHDGYPGVQLLDAVGQRAPHPCGERRATSNSPTSPPPRCARPGATAYFNLAYSDVPTGAETTCPTAAQIEVTPPHAVDHDVVAVAHHGVRRRER